MAAYSSNPKRSILFHTGVDQEMCPGISENQCCFLLDVDGNRAGGGGRGCQDEVLWKILS